jgi:hypothetical protein
MNVRIVIFGVFGKLSCPARLAGLTLASLNTTPRVQPHVFGSLAQTSPVELRSCLIFGHKWLWAVFSCVKRCKKSIVARFGFIWQIVSNR